MAKTGTPKRPDTIDVYCPSVQKSNLQLPSGGCWSLEGVHFLDARVHDANSLTSMPYVLSRSSPLVCRSWLRRCGFLEMQGGSLRIRVSGVELELWDSGNGAPLLFLHGGDGLEGPEEFCTFLKRKYRLITPSHPGFGSSALPSHYSDVSDLGYFYLDMIDKLDLRKILLVGVSFGAWIAADLAIKCTSRIQGVVLAGAVGAKFSDPRTREIGDLFSMPRADMDRMLMNITAPEGIDRSQWTDEALMRAARNHESFSLFAWSPTLHDPKLKYRLHRIDVPTQFIWGAQDRVVSVDYGRQMSECLPKARFDIVAGAGHYVHRDSPAMFAGIVDRFATTLRARG